jgi:hypothetical protein
MPALVSPPKLQKECRLDLKIYGISLKTIYVEKHLKNNATELNQALQTNAELITDLHEE